MSDLFKKLNVLLRAKLDEAMDEAKLPQRRLRARPAPDTQREVKRLREKIEEALAYEETLQTRLTDIDVEIQQLDAQADDAVARGDDADATYLLGRLQRAQQRHAMTEADLREHRLATQALMRSVNELDAAISDVEHQHMVREPGAELEQDETGLSNVVREVRERIEASLVNAPASLQIADETVEAVDQAAVEDDLAQRRARLSGPPKKGQS